MKLERTSFMMANERDILQYRKLSTAYGFIFANLARKLLSVFVCACVYELVYCSATMLPIVVWYEIRWYWRLNVRIDTKTIDGMINDPVYS